MVFLGCLGVAHTTPGCQGEVSTMVTPTPPPDPHDQSDPDEVIYWDTLTEGISSLAFYGMTGFSDSDLYLVGEDGNVWRWNGTELSLLVTLTTPEGAAPDLNSAWSFSDVRGRVLYIAGSGGAIYRYDFLPGDELAADDFEWLETGTRSAFRAVFGLDRDTLWAVGDGGIYRFDGQRWTRDATAPGGVSLFDIWGYWSDDIQVTYAAGRSGTLLMRVYDPGGSEPAAWNPISLGRGEDLHSVWGFGDGTVYVAGQFGLVLEFDGSTWTTWETGVFDHLWAIWGTDRDHMFAVGTSGTTVYFDGNGWQSLGAETYRNLYCAWGTAPSQVFAAGARSTLALFDGEPTPPPVPVEE